MKNIYPKYAKHGDVGIEYIVVDEKNDKGESTSVAFDFSEFDNIQKTQCQGDNLIIGGVDKKHAYCLPASQILHPPIYNATVTPENEEQLDKIVFQCIRHADENGKTVENAVNLFNPFLLIMVNDSGSKGLVKLAQYEQARNHHHRSGTRSIYLRPILDHTGQPVFIDRITSFRNSGISVEAMNYVGANHCQDGTDLQLYNIVVCAGEQCLGERTQKRA